MQAIITGKIGNAEQKSINGRDYLRLSVADRQRNGDTQWVEVFTSYSDKMAEFLVKGASITAIGNLTMGTYTAKDGSTKVSATIWAFNLSIAAFADAAADDDLPI